MGDFKNDRFILQWQDKIQLIFRIRPEEIIQHYIIKQITFSFANNIDVQYISIVSREYNILLLYAVAVMNSQQSCNFVNAYQCNSLKRSFVI